MPIEHARRIEHAVERRKIANHVAAIVELRKTAKGYAQSALDGALVEPASPLGARFNRLTEHIVRAFVQCADQRAVPAAPTRQRVKIVHVEDAFGQSPEEPGHAVFEDTSAGAEHGRGWTDHPRQRNQVVLVAACSVQREQRRRARRSRRLEPMNEVGGHPRALDA